MTSDLYRQALRETMADQRRSVESLAPVLGSTIANLRAYLGGLPNPRIEKEAEWYLGSLETRNRADLKAARRQDRYRAQTRSIMSPVQSPVQQKKRGPKPRVVPDGYRWCPACKQIKPKDEYYGNGYCKPCGRAKAAEYARRRKDQAA
ncbi:MAG: hypothetical protein IT477_10750 [Rhodanobacteraceae bacterium]|nr:hypothetical protein [Rhodanobacteraceae bacterium]